jgi:hypothetical protein
MMIAHAARFKMGTTLAGVVGVMARGVMEVFVVPF